MRFARHACCNVNMKRNLLCPNFTHCFHCFAFYLQSEFPRRLWKPNEDLRKVHDCNHAITTIGDDCVELSRRQDWVYWCFNAGRLSPSTNGLSPQHFLLLFPSLLSLSFPPSSPVFLNSAKRPRERCKLPQWVSSEAPTSVDFLAILSLKKTHFRNKLERINYL